MGGTDYEVKDTKEPSSSGFIDKIICVIFNVEIHEERDIKWSKPWKTHKEAKALRKVGKSKKVESSSNLLSSIVELIMGYNEVPRDPKFAKPWKTHPEFKKVKSKIDASSLAKDESILETVFEQLICFIFNIKVDEDRDPKWATPWKMHEDAARLQKTDKISAGTESSQDVGLIPSLIEFIMGYEPTARDPKFSNPWKTHPEFVEKEIDPIEEAKIEGLSDLLVKLIFNIEYNQVRSNKWSKPWKT